MFGMSHIFEIWIFVGLGVMVILFLMSGMARLYRKAGPHEALIVYGFGGTRVVKGHGTLVFPDGPDLPRAFAGTDVVRRGAAAGSLHQAGRGGHGRSRGADQGEVGHGVHPDRVRTIPHQDRSGARRPDPPGDGRPSARHHRPAHGGRNREAAGDGCRPHALHLRRRHEQDGPGSHFVHHQGSPRQERVHHQHGQARRRAHQARCRRGHRGSRSRHRHQARAGATRIRGRQSAGRPGASAGGNAVAGQAGGSAARPRSQESAVRRSHQAAAGAGRQGLRHPDQHHAAAGHRRAGEGAADRERAAGQSAGSGNQPPREGTDRDRVEGGGDRASANRNSGRWPKSSA